jgi:hypothetical protein
MSYSIGGFTKFHQYSLNPHGCSFVSELKKLRTLLLRLIVCRCQHLGIHILVLYIVLFFLYSCLTLVLFLFDSCFIFVSCVFYSLFILVLFLFCSCFILILFLFHSFFFFLFRFAWDSLTCCDLIYLP